MTEIHMQTTNRRTVCVRASGCEGWFVYWRRQVCAKVSEPESFMHDKCVWVYVCLGEGECVVFHFISFCRVQLSFYSCMRTRYSLIVSACSLSFWQNVINANDSYAIILSVIWNLEGLLHFKLLSLHQQSSYAVVWVVAFAKCYLHCMVLNNQQKIDWNT